MLTDHFHNMCSNEQPSYQIEKWIFLKLGIVAKIILYSPWNHQKTIVRISEGIEVN